VIESRYTNQAFYCKIIWKTWKKLWGCNAPFTTSCWLLSNCNNGRLDVRSNTVTYYCASRHKPPSSSYWYTTTTTGINPSAKTGCSLHLRRNTKKVSSIHCCRHQ
jgi:hypothetical protein